ncbi:MAG: glycosyltransferase family 2 protein [Acidobacteriota bacterium]
MTAVIPHWNRRQLLEGLLENLRQQTRPFDEVIVVDNGSTDESADAAERAGVRVVRLPANMGFAAAVNRGIAAASAADWVAILNNDVTLSPEWLSTLLQAANGPDVWFACGKILSAADRSLIDGLWDEISRGACPMRIGAGALDGPAWSSARPIRMTSMTACLVRRGLFDQLGSLDERFESYLEDVDFGLRCAKAGKAGVYAPKAISSHQGSSTWGRWNPDTVRLLSRNQVLLTAKHFRGQAWWPIVAGQLLWGMLALRHGCVWAWLRGKFAGLRMAGQIEDATADPAAFRILIRESEEEILAAQRQTGPSQSNQQPSHKMDSYWRVYTWLVRS